MNRTLLLLTCTLATSAAWAQATITQSPAYQECTALASTNPAQALVKAEAWLKIDSSIAAQHCHAMALYGLRRFGEAGDALSIVRDGIGTDNVALRSYIARQAARAWLNATLADKALALLSAQITELGTVRGDNAATAKLTSELLLDRARLNASYGKFDDATKDLDHAISLTPIDEEVLMERAGVFEKLGDLPLARSDAHVVLKLNANNAAAKTLLTRLGAIKPPAANLSAPAVTTPERAAATAPVNASYAPTSDATSAPVTAVSETAMPFVQQPVSAPAAKPVAKRSSKAATKQPPVTPASEAP